MKSFRTTCSTKAIDIDEGCQISPASEALFGLRFRGGKKDFVEQEKDYLSLPKSWSYRRSSRCRVEARFLLFLSFPHQAVVIIAYVRLFTDYVKVLRIQDFVYRSRPIGQLGDGGTIPSAQ